MSMAVIESLKYGFQKKYPLGAESSGYDPRDYSVAFTGKETPVWPVSDQIPDTIPNYDQDAGTCVAQGIRHAPQRKYNIEFGTNFLYGLARGENEKNRKGLQMRPALDFFSKYGLAPLSVDPGEKEVPEAVTYALRNKDALMLAAAPYKGWTYARLYTVDEIKAAIRDRLDVIFVMKVSTYKTNKFGWFPGDKLKVGNHLVKLIGYGQYPITGVRTREGALVRNSWGEGWGISGDCYMEWEDVLACNEIFVLFPPAEIVPISDPIIKVRRTLRYGMSGDDVLEAQKLLLKHGKFPEAVEPRGNFGSDTRDATLAFQHAKGLVADAIIGKNTWAALDKDPEDKSNEPSDIKKRFMAYLYEQVGQMYCWGGKGQHMTPALIKKMENSTANYKRALAFYEGLLAAGKSPIIGYDCSGLISRFLQNEGLVTSKRNCNHLHAMCTGIKREELQPFDLLFRWNGVKPYYHVGVYIGDGLCIEAQGRDEGVVLRTIDADGSSYWNRFGRLQVLQEG